MNLAISLICCLVALPEQPPGIEGDAERVPSAEDVAAKARAGMEEYVAKVATRLCGAIRDRSGPGRIPGGSRSNQGPLWDERKVTIVQNGRYGYWIEETNYFDGSPPVSLAMLYGPRVKASLRKGEDGKWSVTDYRAKEGRAVDCWPLTAWTAMGYMLEALPIRERSKQIWSEGVRLGEIEWDEVDGRRLLRVEFEIPEVPPSGERGELWLDPERMWAMARGWTERLVRGRDDQLRTMRSEFRFEYDESYAPYPVPTKDWGHWVVKGATENPEGWYEQIFKLSIPDKPPADEEFTLARFGVPNVAGLPLRRKETPWLWIGLMACIAAALLWWVRRRMRGTAHEGGSEIEG